MKPHRQLTIMDLVQIVQESAASDREAVAVLTHLFNSKRVRRATV